MNIVSIHKISDKYIDVSHSKWQKTVEQQWYLYSSNLSFLYSFKTSYEVIFVELKMLVLSCNDYNSYKTLLSTTRKKIIKKITSEFTVNKK